LHGFALHLCCWIPALHLGFCLQLESMLVDWSTIEAL